MREIPITNKLTFAVFVRYLIQRCNLHRKKGKALAFAFILYDYNSPQIKQLLANDDYWHSLNQISGKFLTVFHLGDARTNNATINSAKVKSPHPFEVLNDRLDYLRNLYFQNQSLEYPSILFFQVNKTAVTQSLMVELEEQDIQKAFFEIREYLKAAVTALEIIGKDYYNNQKEIFDCLERAVKSLHSKKVTIRNFQLGNSVLGFISSLFGLKS
jgi:type III secretory pathway component EscV